MKTLKLLSGMLLVAAALTICLSSCDSSKSALIGKWEYKGGESFEIEGVWDDLNFFERNWEAYGDPDMHGVIIEFKKDGSYCYDSGDKLVSESYIVNDGGIVVLRYQDINNTFRYDIRGDSLSLTSGSKTATFQKAEAESSQEHTVITITVLSALFIGAAIIYVSYKKRHSESIAAFEQDEDVYDDIDNDSEQ